MLGAHARAGGARAGHRRARPPKPRTKRRAMGVTPQGAFVLCVTFATCPLIPQLRLVALTRVSHGVNALCVPTPAPLGERSDCLRIATNNPAKNALVLRPRACELPYRTFVTLFPK